MFGWERMAVRNREGLLVHCAVVEKALTKVSFAPVWRNEVGQPRIVSPASTEGRHIVRTVEKLSTPLGTDLQGAGGEVVVWSAEEI